MIDSTNVTAVCDEPSVITDDQRQAARRTVAQAVSRLGGDAAELKERLQMLGIYPGQELEEIPKKK